MTVLLRIIISVMKHYDQKQLWEKGFIWLAYPKLQFTEGTQIGLEPGGRS